MAHRRGSDDSCRPPHPTTREFRTWQPELVALITDADGVPMARPIHTLPIGHRWRRTAGVTLLGDAAHLMPPSGDGANLAMLDGAELGLALAARPDDPDAALAAYQDVLFPRSIAVRSKLTTPSRNVAVQLLPPASSSC